MERSNITSDWFVSPGLSDFKKGFECSERVDFFYQVFPVPVNSQLNVILREEIRHD